MVVDSEPSVAPGESEVRRVFERLCNVMALSSSGRLEGAIDQLVELSLAFTKKTESFNTTDDVRRAVRGSFALKLSTPILEESIKRLKETGKLEGTPTGLRLNKETFEKLSNQLADKKALENLVKQEWFQELSQVLPEIPADYYELLWKALLKYMSSAFHQYGVQFSRLIDPSIDIGDEHTRRLSDFMREAIRQTCPEVDETLARKAMSRFFIQPDAVSEQDSEKRSRRLRSNFISETINGTVTLFSLAIDEATSKYLQAALKPLVVFVDTNYIFGLLSLHLNPLDEVSVDLLRIIQEHKLNIRLVYHPLTIDELGYRIEKDARPVRRVKRWSRESSESALHESGLNGIELSFHRENSRAGGNLDTSIWFEQFRHLEVLLGEYGLTRYEGDQATEQSEAQLVARRVQYSEYLAGVVTMRERLDGQVHHDMSLVTCVDFEREKITPKAAVKSPLEAGAFILSVDRHFQQFDRRFLHRNTVPAVILPTHLLQLVRPFIRSTDDDFDLRFYEIFGNPELRVLSDKELDGRRKALEYLNHFGPALSIEARTEILANRMFIEQISELSTNEALEDAFEPKLRRQFELLEKNTREIASESDERKEVLRESEKALRETRVEMDRLREANTALHSRYQQEIGELRDLVAQFEQSQSTPTSGDVSISQNQITVSIPRDDNGARDDQTLSFKIWFGLAGLLVAGPAVLALCFLKIADSGIGGHSNLIVKLTIVWWIIVIGVYWWKLIHDPIWLAKASFVLAILSFILSF